MHAFTGGGAHLVFVDGFGLTRLTRPKAVKTDKEASGLALTVGESHALVRRSYRRAFRTLPALARAKWPFSDYDEFALLPDGDRAVEVSNQGVRVLRVTGEVLSTFQWPDAMTSVGALDLGRERPPKAITKGHAATGPGDVLAVFNPYHRVVWVGRIGADGQCTPRWRAEVGVPVGGLLLFPSETETFVGAWDRGTREAKLHRVDGDRGVTHRTISSVSAPTFSGSRWCWQPSDEVVCRAPWDALDPPERFTLPAAARGEGELMAHGDVLLFVPSDRERIVDVVTGAVVDRKLGAGDASVRAMVMGAMGVFDPWLGAEGGRLDFGAATREKNGTVTWAPVFDAGAGSLTAHLAIGEILGRQRHVTGDPNDLSVPSYSPPTGLARVTLDDVRRGFARLDACGAKLLRAACGLDTPLKYHFEPPYNDRNRRELAAPEPRFEPLAAAALLRAIMETAGRGERVPLAENVDRWSATPLTADELLGFEHPDNTWEAGSIAVGAHALSMVTAWVALDALRAAAAPVLARWLVTDATGHARSNPHIACEVGARMVQYFPETEAAFRAACEASEQGAAIWRGVESELRG